MSGDEREQPAPRDLPPQLLGEKNLHGLGAGRGRSAGHPNPIPDSFPNTCIPKCRKRDSLWQFSVVCDAPNKASGPPRRPPVFVWSVGRLASVRKRTRRLPFKQGAGDCQMSRRRCLYYPGFPGATAITRARGQAAGHRIAVRYKGLRVPATQFFGRFVSLRRVAHSAGSDVRFAAAATDDHATLAKGRPSPAGPSPAGTHQLRLAQ